jgi:adenosyl cobinamide kinase/adenosyl cobinamide phosphate guanylyltransferase
MDNTIYTTAESARHAIQHLLDGGPPDQLPPADYGGWGEIVITLCDTHATGGTSAVQHQFETLARAYPDLAKLIASHPSSAHRNGRTNGHTNGTHPLQPRFRLISPDDLVQLPPPTFLVKDTIVLGETTVIAGPGDSGKTFLVTDMCWKVAQHYPVCYVAAEDAQGVSLRMQAWCKHHQRPRPQNFRVLGTGAGVPCAVELMDTSQIDDLILTLQATQIKLVVIDTLSQCSGGAEENGSDMTRLAAACNRIAHTTGAAVVVIHHTTKDGKHYRGHSSLKDNTYGFFDVAKEDDVINLAKVRVKNTGSIADRHFRLVTIDLGTVDTYGDPITSAVALPAHKVKVTGDDLTPSRREVLSQITLMQDADEAPKAAQVKQCLREMHERTFYRALKWLREHDYVKQGGMGMSNRYYVTDTGRNKLEQANDDPNTASNLLLDEEYFLVNTRLPDPDPTPPGGASYTPPVPPDIQTSTDTRPDMTGLSVPPAASAGPPTASTDTPPESHAGDTDAENAALTPDLETDTPPDMSGMSVPTSEQASAGAPDAVCDTAPDTDDTTTSGITEANSDITDTYCHSTDNAPLSPAELPLTDLPPASERQWQSVQGQPTETPTPDSEPLPLIDQARNRLEQAAALLNAGESDSTARSLLNGLSGWLKKIVRSGIDRMIQARRSGQMSIDEALRLSLDKLQTGGAP